MTVPQEPQAPVAQVERIVVSYSNMLLRVAMHYMKGRADAEDVVQTVFLRLLRESPRFDSQEHEKAWLLRVAINLCKDAHKAAWRRHTVLADPPDTPVYDEEPFPQVLAAVRELPPNHRAAIYLHYYENLTVPQIAQLMEAPEGTVMSWLHRGRAKLKTLLKGGL